MRSKQVLSSCIALYLYLCIHAHYRGCAWFFTCFRSSFIAHVYTSISVVAAEVACQKENLIGNVSCRMIYFPYFIYDEKHKKIAVYTAMLDLFVDTWHELSLPMEIPGILPLYYNTWLENVLASGNVWNIIKPEKGDKYQAGSTVRGPRTTNHTYNNRGHFECYLM